nr:IS3 family transposase [Clostridium muellerianum]
MLCILGVSRSGYNSWLHCLPSNQQKRKQSVKKKIKEIYDKSHQNYGALKITKEIQKTGEKISERTIGKYM